mgnify:CR=1 FL=1
MSAEIVPGVRTSQGAGGDVVQAGARRATTSVEAPHLDDLRRARQALIEAELSEKPAERYLGAYTAAMRVAVTVLAVRARPQRGHGPADLWRVLMHAAPEYTEWAAFFAAGREKRELVLAGATAVVSERDADDLLRDAGEFCDLVEQRFVRAWRARHG